MAVKAQIVKWGNSQAVRIPKSVLEKAAMREGEHVELHVERGRISLQPAKPKLTIDLLVQRIHRKNLHGEQDWGGAVGGEPW